jgi:hypothetical protein
MNIPLYFGPYNEEESQTITEDLLESLELSHSLKQLLMGVITQETFLIELEYAQESSYLNLLERRKQEGMEHDMESRRENENSFEEEHG